MIRSSLRIALLALPVLAASLRPAGAFTAAEARAPMTATLVRGDARDCGADCPEWLALTGKIGFDTPPRLQAALAGLKGRKVPVLLDSPGGESLAALAMGRAIRARGLDTAVASTTLTDCEVGDAACAARRAVGLRPGHVGADGRSVAACASACVLVLAGGVRRDVPRAAAVGVHQALRVLTYHPRINFFRILRRTVGGRTVEVSRTLVGTRALPDRVVKGAAPASLYSQFDRYLVGMGVDESIVALMRETPPSGIHWMTPAEIAGTRIATDGTDGAALVERESSSQAAAASLRAVDAPAALTLDDGRRWTGTVRWRIDASAPAAPALVGDWDVPGRRLGGRLTLAADAAPNAEAAFRLDASLRPAAGPDALSVLEIDAPRLCDLSLCMPTLSGDAAFDRAAAAFDVRTAWRDSFLTDLRRRDWLMFRVRTGEGRGDLAITLSSPDGQAIPAWERACCGPAWSDVRWTAPASDLPPPPREPVAFFVPGFKPVDPIASVETPPPRSLPVQALLDVHPAREGSAPAALGGTVLWTPVAASTALDGPGATALLADVAVPGAGVHAWAEVRPSPPGVLGRLAFTVHVATGEGPFGIPASFSVLHILDPHGHPLMFADSVWPEHAGGPYRAYADVPATGPIAGALQLAFTDAAHRRLTVAVPFDGIVAGILQAASRGQPAGTRPDATASR